MHFDVYSAFQLPQTVGPRRRAAEKTSHLFNSVTKWFKDGCPGEVENVTPRFLNQVANQKRPNFVVKLSVFLFLD